MNAFDRLEYALKYPLSREESTYKPLLVGGVLIISLPLILPMFIIFGYQLRVYESSINENQLPQFENLTNLLKEGFKGTLVLTPGILLILLFNYIPTGLVVTGAVPIPDLLYIILFLLFTLIGSVTLTILIILYSTQRTFQGTYNVSKITDILTDKDYLIGFALFFILLALVQLLLLIPSILIITIPFIAFYTSVVSSAYLGHLTRKYF